MADHELKLVWRSQTTDRAFTPAKPPVDRGGGPPDDGGMDARVAKLEEFAVETRERMARMETRLEQTVTSAELHKEMNAQTWRLITFVCSFGAALVGITYFLATHVK